MSNGNGNNDKVKQETVRVKVERLEEVTGQLSKDVSNLKVEQATLCADIKHMGIDIHESTKSVENLCKTIGDFKDDNAKTIVQNAFSLGRLTGQMKFVWAIIVLLLTGITLLGFNSFQTKNILQNNHVRLEAKEDMSGK